MSDMRWYTGELSTGEVRYAVARPGLEPDTAARLARVAWWSAGQGPPWELFEWHTAEQFACAVVGRTPPAGQSWGTLYASGPVALIGGSAGPWLGDPRCTGR